MDHLLTTQTHRSTTLSTCLVCYGSVAGVCFSPEDTIMHCPSSGTEPRNHYLEVVNLQSYPLSCIPVIVGIVALHAFLQDTTVQFAQCGHCNNNPTITLLHSNRLGNTTAN